MQTGQYSSPFVQVSFDDMNLFHKVVYKVIPVTMPDYLTLYSGGSRIRSTHLDNLSFVSNIALTTISILSNLNKSIFFRKFLKSIKIGHTNLGMGGTVLFLG